MQTCFWSDLVVWRKDGLFYKFKAYFHLKIYILCFLHIMASPGLKRGNIQHFMASFDFLYTCRRDEVVGESLCVVPAAFLLVNRSVYLPRFTLHLILLSRVTQSVCWREEKKNASSDVITSSLCLSRDTDLVTWYAFNNGGIMFSTEVFIRRRLPFITQHPLLTGKKKSSNSSVGLKN